MKLILTLALLLTTAHADVTVPRLFSSHMILQRDLPIHIWGDAPQLDYEPVRMTRWEPTERKY